MFKKKNKSIFEKIDDHLAKQKHEPVMSLYLENYNNSNIFIRFDYCHDIKVYKMLWIDLNFYDEKNFDKYISSQTMTGVMANKLVDMLCNIDYENGAQLNDKIIGDRVEFVNYQTKEIHEYIFDRFLPLEWEKLIDPLAIVFTYLPRTMEVFLNEIFAKFDGYEERYNAMKPIKFNLFSDELDDDYFKPSVISQGRKEYLDDRVTFLEKVDETRYMAIVEGNIKYLVVIKEIDKEHVMLWCNCKSDIYCKHIYAVLLALRNKKFNNFYKVTYTGNSNETLLHKLSEAQFSYCYGIDGDNLLIIGTDLIFKSIPLLDHKGKCVFKVIEDDDNLSLSKIIDSYKK